MRPDGRYAPSPTGALHLGNLRTALLAWLFARSAGARFLVRVEDLDAGRVREELVGLQLGDLAALGLDWDEPPLRQSERTDRYAAAVEVLRGHGLVYECFCTRAEIREAASAPHGPPGAYPGTCRELSTAERERRRASGRPPALRVRAGGARMTVADRLHGPQEAEVDDLVLRRNDGAWAYGLAVVVDDAAMGVGEVVRGADLLSSAPRQAWLAQALGVPGPSSWVHVPLVLGPDGQRLAKRHGSVTLADRVRDGHDAAGVRAELAASVGLCEPGERPSAAELVDRFDPARLPTADTVWPAH